MVNERNDGDAAQSMALVKAEIDENGERDKLVQFEKTPDESSYAQNYLTNVSAISYVSNFTHFCIRIFNWICSVFSKSFPFFSIKMQENQVLFAVYEFLQ